MENEFRSFTELLRSQVAQQQILVSVQPDCSRVNGLWLRVGVVSEYLRKRQIHAHSEGLEVLDLL